MLLDPMGGIVTTNDGNCILREIMVQDPAPKSCPEQTNFQKKSWELSAIISKFERSAT